MPGIIPKAGLFLPPFTHKETKAQKGKVTAVKLLRFEVSSTEVKGFPGGASGKEPTYQCRRHETQVRPLGQEDPLEEGMATL